MPNNKISLYVHLVWATWNREALIAPEIERTLHRCIEEQAIKQQCDVIAINGITDHIHILVAMPPTISVSELVKLLKGPSSHFVMTSYLQTSPSNGKAATAHLASAAIMCAKFETTYDDKKNITPREE